MALDNFIPEIWSANLLVSLQKSFVYADPYVINGDYEGEIRKMGDSVRISSIGDPTISNYVKNTAIGNPQELTSAQSTLTISQAKSFNFMVDDVDAAQANISVMQEAMRRAAYRLKDGYDQFIAALYTDIAAANITFPDTAPFTPTITAGTGYNDAYDQLITLEVKLDENNIPEDGRWVVIPPWYEGLLLRDNRFVSFGTDANRDTLANGVIGRVGGMVVKKSNNVPNITGTKYKIIAGHSMAWSAANQINEVEAYRHQQFFADAMRGLFLYGAKVLRPESLAMMSCNRPAGA